MLPADDSANVDHSIWCQQVAEQDFEYVGCTCGALKEEMRLRELALDAARWRMARKGDGQTKWLDVWDEMAIDAALVQSRTC